jgi:hypothetical protein
MKETILNHFLDYEFVYVFLFCFLFFLLISMFATCKVVKKISIVLCSLFLVLFLFELGFSFFMEKCFFVPRNDELFKMPKGQNIILAREVFLLNEKNNMSKMILSDNKDEIYKNTKEYLSKGYKIFYDNNFSLYSNGLRYTKSNINGENIYVFLGGSFTVGAYVDDKETLPYYFSELNNFDANVLNLGYGAKGSNYTLNMLNSEIIDGFVGENKEVTCFIYSLIEDHIYRNFRMINSNNGGFDPWIKKDNKWIFMADHPYKRIKKMFVRSFLFRRTFLKVIDNINVQYYKNYLLSSLKEMDEIIENRYKSKLIIIVWPEFYDNNFMESLQNLNIDLILLPEYFNSEELGYRLKDHHPTAKANKEIAEILYNHINNQVRENINGENNNS